MRRLLLAIGFAVTLAAGIYASSCSDDLRPPPVFVDGSAGAEAGVDGAAPDVAVTPDGAAPDGGAGG